MWSGRNSELDFKNLANLARPFFLPFPLPLFARASVNMENGLVQETTILGTAKTPEEPMGTAEVLLDIYTKIPLKQGRSSPQGIPFSRSNGRKNGISFAKRSLGLFNAHLRE